MMTKNRRAARYSNNKAAIKQNLSADYIKQTLFPRDFYRHELLNTPLKKHGWNDGGLCPFHGDNKPGSFRVNLATGAYKCFACGAAGADVIAFTMALYGLKFVEALEQLANDWGLA
jgi:DNA primase